MVRKYGKSFLQRETKESKELKLKQEKEIKSQRLRHIKALKESMKDMRKYGVKLGEKVIDLLP